MRTFIFSLLVTFLLSTRGLTAPAVPGTLQDYINLGATGATIDSTLFSDFTLLPLQAGATEILAANILVTPTGGPGNPALQFNLNSDAGAGELLEARFTYLVTDFSLTGAGLSMSGATAVEDAAVTVVEVLEAAAITPVSLIVFEIEGLAEHSAQESFPSVTQLLVSTDIVVDGGTSGRGTFGTTTSSFVTVPIPESSPMLAGVAILGVGLLGHARRRR